MVEGKFVQTFAEASHALPMGMHMNSDYPFMLPKIARIKGRRVFLRPDRGDDEGSFIVRLNEQGEYGYLAQMSSYERIFNRKPTRYKFRPFKDSNTPVPGKDAA